MCPGALRGKPWVVPGCELRKLYCDLAVIDRLLLSVPHLGRRRWSAHLFETCVELAM